MMVKSIAHLKILSKDRSKKFHIRLIGWIKSVKRIKFDPKKNRFSIFSEIDNTRLYLTPSELKDKEFTNIGEAIRRKAFYVN